MNNCRQIKPLNNTDAAYTAGLIDGEGTITVSRKHKNENRQLCVSISSTEIVLLDFVLSVSGIGKITNKKTGKSLHSHSYAYAVYNRPALALLGFALRYLKSYRKNAPN